MDTFEVIEYLLFEIEKEMNYNEKYEKAEKKARKQAEVTGQYWWHLLDSQFKNHSPRQSVIKANALKIRQLLLKMY